MSLEEENIAQFHKEKNYQLELIQIKHEEDVGRIQREHEIQVDEFLRDIKHKDYQLKERDEQIRYLDLRISEIKQEYDSLDRELQRSREQHAVTTDDLTKAEFQIKKLSMLVEELEGYKS